MTEAQIFQVSGITFFAMGVGMLSNPNFIGDMVKDFLGSVTNVFYGGLACIAIGFPLVTFYTSWKLDASLVITLLGWLSMAKGLMLLMFPTFTTNAYRKVLEKESSSAVAYGVLAFGIVLLYLGYLA